MSIDWDDAVIAPVMDVFGEAVTYRPKDGAPFEITGILTEAYLEVDAVGDAVPMSGQQSRLNVRLSAFMEIEPQPGDTLRCGAPARPIGCGKCAQTDTAAHVCGSMGRAEMLMRAHFREQAVATLKAAHTTAGQNVFSPRDWPTWCGEYPLILVHTPRERKASITRGIPQFNTTLWLAVSARVETHSAEAAYADLETLGAQIEAALLTDFNLISQLQHIAFVDTRIEVNAQSKGHLGEVQIDFGLEFYEVFDPVTQSPVQPIATPLEGIDVQHALRPE